MKRAGLSWAINYEPVSSVTEITMDKGWIMDECYYGETPSENKKAGRISITINKNDAMIFKIKKI